MRAPPEKPCPLTLVLGCMHAQQKLFAKHWLVTLAILAICETMDCSRALPCLGCVGKGTVLH